jgi:hypothetical protein
MIKPMLFNPMFSVVNDPIASMAMWTNDPNAISGIKTDE